MRIAGAIGVGVMAPMRRDPGDRTAFHPQDAEHRDRVVEPTRHTQALVRQHTMKAQRKPNAPGEVTQDDRDCNTRPREGGRNQCQQRPEVEDKQPYSRSLAVGRNPGREQGFTTNLLQKARPYKQPIVSAEFRFESCARTTAKCASAYAFSISALTVRERQASHS